MAVWTQVCFTALLKRRVRGERKQKRSTLGGAVFGGGLPFGSAFHSGRLACLASATSAIRPSSESFMSGQGALGLEARNRPRRPPPPEKLTA